MNEAERQRKIRSKLVAGESARAPAALPTGFRALDAALGIGGLPRGRIVEIFGPASCGKTALALQIAGHAQRSGAAVVWIDAEHVFDPAFAGRLGVELSRLAITEPRSAEEAFDMARRFVASGAVDLIVIDSAAALVPQLEMAMTIGQPGAGFHARVLARELRRLAMEAARSTTSIVFLNQIRIRVEGPGELETSSGGAALKLHASVRISLAAIGRRVHVRVVKNRFAPAFISGELDWRPGQGFAEAR